jgi:hypothetical protein
MQYLANRKLVQALMLILLLSSCGEKMEIVSSVSTNPSTVKTGTTELINGIAVPPEPDPVANNATLAGVDSNSNGVRDDVERQIAIAVINQTEFNNAIQKAKANQDIVLAYNANISRTELLSIKKTGICGGNVSRKIRMLSLDSILNNDARRLAYIKANTVIGGINGDEVICD